MSERSAHHATFVIERVYPVAPARVFNAWADPATKTRWFSGPDAWSSGRHAIDFRIGGHERISGGPAGGPIYTFNGVYQDIVPNERIVLSYELLMDETRVSVSLATVEFKAAVGGTRLIYTEQGVFLDGHDDPAEREHGTGDLLDALGAELQREPATA